MDYKAAIEEDLNYEGIETFFNTSMTLSEEIEEDLNYEGIET